VTTPLDPVTTYVEWLRQNSRIRDVGGMVQITLPFLDRHNDFIQIYVKPDGEDLVLTDDGYVLSDLKASGCNINTPERCALLEKIIQGHGIHLDQQELTARATPATLALRLQSLLLAMLALGNLSLSEGT